MNERDQKLALKCRLIAEHTGGIYADSLQAFANLIRADEREACLDLAESYAKNNTELRDAIRARGAK